jgi:hypothetical protein
MQVTGTVVGLILNLGMQVCKPKLVAIPTTKHDLSR